MPDNILNNQSASIYSDINSLNSIRKMGLTDESGALKKAAKEFEAFFLNMMLKSMRQANAAIGDDSMMSSSQEKMFTSMLDEQLAVDLSQKGLLGIADLMTHQLINKSAAEKQLSGNEVNTKVSLKSDLNSFGIVPSLTEKSDRNVNSNLIKASDKLTNSKPDVIPEPASDLDKTNILETVNLHLRKGIKETIVEQTDIAKIAVEKPAKKAVFTQVNEFVSSLLPLAKEAAQKLMLDPKLLIAQAALETGWGKFVMHDESGTPGFNLFGIKAGKGWGGETIKIDTLEVENGAFKKINASFRKYENFKQSFDDYVDFVQQNPRYQKATESTTDAKEYIHQLQKSGYATDPEYANKIMKIFNETLLDTIDTGTR